MKGDDDSANYFGAEALKSQDKDQLGDARLKLYLRRLKLYGYP